MPKRIFRNLMDDLGFISKKRLHWYVHPPQFSATPPPSSTIPDELMDAYSMGGKIPVLYQYYDGSIRKPLGNAEQKTPHFTKKDYARVYAALEKETFDYYGKEVNTILDAIDDYSVVDKTVTIWGLYSPNCEVISLWKGAKHVYVVDYNKPICELENVTVLTHDEFKQANVKTDFAISYSSFEHDGLGRYGDPLDPDGDLRAMKEAHESLNDGGILFLGVPCGQDSLVFNAHRIYGEKRLFLLLKGWNCLGVYNCHKDIASCPFDLPENGAYQVTMVLEKSMSEYSRSDLLKNSQQVDTERKGKYQTYDPETCNRINASILKQLD